MYKLLLILRYLRRKIAPMFAVLAVTLCTAMVIIVISVMGGFLKLMTESAHALEGDMTVISGLRGFEHYEKLLEDVRQLPQVEAATAVINNYGLLNLGNDFITHVQIIGINGDEFNKVIDYRDSLYWTPDRTAEHYPNSDLTELGMTLKPPESWGPRPGIVLGIAISPTNERNSKGQYDFINSIVGRPIPVTLTAMLIQRSGTPSPRPKQMIVVNEFKSGLYEVDKLRVFVDFGFLQKTLQMDRFEGKDENDSPVVEPARANDIMIKSRPDVSLDELEQAVSNVKEKFLNEHPSVTRLQAVTWKQRYATFLGAVEKEKFMLTILFAIISVVAVVMIGVVFYMIVLEKTHDIGVLRAMGASRSGIAAIFLGYGITVGLIGAGLGLVLAAAVVYNINEIQDWLTHTFGFTMWDPKIYFFDKIPARLDPTEVVVIMVLSISSGLLGAVVPALLAGRLNPVEALRYE